MNLQEIFKGIKSNQEKIVIQWLLNQNDELLINNINKCPDADFNKCWNFIVGNARKMAVNNCACIQDDQVFQWAKDYFNDYEVRKEQEKIKVEERKAASELATLKNRKSNIISGYDNLLQRGLITTEEYPKGAIESVSISKDTMDITSTALKVYEEKLQALNEKFKDQLKVVVAESDEEEEKVKPVITKAKPIKKETKKKVEVKPVAKQQNQFNLFDFLGD